MASLESSETADFNFAHTVFKRRNHAQEKQGYPGHVDYLHSNKLYIQCIMRGTEQACMSQYSIGQKAAGYLSYMLGKVKIVDYYSTASKSDMNIEIKDEYRQGEYCEHALHYKNQTLQYIAWVGICKL